MAIKKDKTLNAKEIEVLRELQAFAEQHPKRWARPMDVGAWDSSHHSLSLRKLVAKGLAERRLRGTLRNMIGSRRGSYEYKINAKGEAILQMFGAMTTM